MTTLAERLVQHPKWKWEPGMVDTNGSVVLACSEGEPLMAWHSTGLCSDVADEWGTGALPDIEHPATKGWHLAMLREAHPMALCFLTPYETPSGEHVWDVRDTCVGLHVSGGFSVTLASAPTEGEALAAALLAVLGEP